MSVQLFDCDSFWERESDRKGNRSRLRMHHTYYNWPLTHFSVLITPLLFLGFGQLRYVVLE